MPYRWTLTNLSDLTTEVLTRDPIGWDEGTYSIKRSDIYKGAFHEYTTSLKFHCDGGGKAFVDNVYNTEDIDGRIDVLVEYDCDGSGVYDTLFNGIINLASYKTDGQYTTVNIEKSDLLTKLFGRDEISVDLATTTSIGEQAITAVASENIALSPIDVLYLGDWRVNDGYTWTGTESFVATGAKQGSFQPEMIMNYGDMDKSNQISEVGNFAENYMGYIVYHTGYEYTPFVTANELAISYPIPVDWEIDFRGSITVNASVGGKTVRARLMLTYGNLDPTSPTPTQVTLYDSGVLSSNPEVINFSIQDSNSISLNAGDGIIVEWLFDFNITTAPATVSVDFVYESSFFKTETTTRFNSTNATTFFIHEAFNQVVDAIADSNGNFYSDFYGRTDSEKQTYAEDGCGSKIAITNGLNIREFDKPIYASFKSLFDNFDCLHNIGMGIVNSKVRVEPLSYWFDGTTKIISLPLVNWFEQKNDNTKYINRVDVGYQKWESEFRGGLDDPNSRHEYSTTISSCKNRLSKLCTYIASPYSIEFTRRKNKTIISSEDWRYDNDNFLIAVRNVFSGELRFRTTNSLIVDGYNLSGIQVGDTIIVTGTSLNDGTYTVATISATENFTTMTFVETVNFETVTATLNDITNKIYNPETYPDSFSYGSGMSSLTTAYNLRLTPARMLQAHLKTIAAGLQIIQGSVTFVNGEGNTDLECSAILPIYTDGCEADYRGQQLKENQSFAWNDANVLEITPIWLPETYTFEYPLTYQQFKTIKANPYGYVEFYKFADDVKNGFILNMEYKMKTGMTKFELLKANV